MHTHLMSLYKKITAVIILILFSFVLLTPTANALNYDWRNPPKGQIIDPTGDDDPFNVEKINDSSIYFYNSIIFYWNLFIIKTLEKPHIINIEKEQYEPERDTETTRTTLVQTGYSGS